MLGIFISVATIFTLVSLSLGLQGAVQEQFRLLGTDKFFIQPLGQIAGPGSGGAAELTLDDVQTIEKVQGVKDLSYFVLRSGKVSYRDEQRYVNIIGIPTDRYSVLEEQEAYKPEEGRSLEKGDRGVVMIGSQYKYNNVFKKELREGDTIKVNDVQFKIRAVLKSTGSPPDDRSIYMPLEDFKELFNQTERIDQILVQTDVDQNITEVSERTERKLRTSRGVTEKTQDFSVQTPEDLLSSFGTILTIITGFLLGIAAISLVVGGVGITNTMYTSVLERTKEIGIMKAIGARNQDILLIFLIESGLLGLIGGIVGVLIGIGISKGIEFIAVHSLGTSLLQAAIPFYLVAGCLIFACLTGALAGLVPSWRASHLNPVEALRYE
jgi:putative ABC transport system permease protein